MHNSAMGSVPIPKLLWHNSIPLIFSLLANSLYNFVDSIFVSYVSEAALTALSIAAPVQALIGAMGCGIAIGLNAAISKAMGQQDERKVRNTASAALFLAVTAWIITAGLCLLFTDSYFKWQSGGNQEIMNAGTVYLRICMLFSLGTFGQWVYDRFAMATGRSHLFLINMAVASTVNLVLDPVLIFGWFGLPAMGTAGAAIATVLGQFSGAVTGILLNERKNPEIPARFSLQFSFTCICDILKVGFPTALTQGIVAFTGILLNTVLQGYSSTAIAVMGICTRLQALAILPPRGIDNALLPIIAYNFGAKEPQRIKQASRWAHIYAFSMMAVILLFLQFFPRQIMSLFDASGAMLAIGIPALRITGIAFFLSVPGLISSTVFQALGQGNSSLCLTLFRQVFLPLALAWLFSRTSCLTLVWVAFPMAELLSYPLIFQLTARIHRLILEPLAGHHDS